MRLSNELPARGTSYDYYSSFPAFRALMDAQSSKLLYMMQRLINYQGAGGSVIGGQINRDFDERFESLIEVNDELLERVGAALDAHERGQQPAAATSKQQQKPQQSNQPTQTLTPASAAAVRFLAARIVARPQDQFQLKPDNSAAPFRSRLRVKHNALQAGAAAEQLAMQPGQHPYGPELDAFTPEERFLGSPPSPQQPPAPPPPQRLDETELTLVQTTDDLAELLALLDGERELAVDLEAHSYRSYLGITCLIQISTRTRDFIVDTLRLWDHVWQLNRIFTNPKILKVLHGSSGDLAWLQRDFGIYMVNLFDTYLASHTLSMPRHSLAHLVQTYCGFALDKQYQLADWRVRPLPAEMLRYARCDTRYLLYIADRMRAELWRRADGQPDLVLRVFDASRRLCRELYKKPSLGADDYRQLLAKSRKAFNSGQIHALERLYAWRDATARVEDESVAYVLPDHMLLAVCDLLPREFTGVLACCNPVPPLVRKYVHDLHRIVLEARELRPADAAGRKSVGGGSGGDGNVGSGVTDPASVANASLSYAAAEPTVRQLPQHRCPHDLSHFGDDDFACASPPPSPTTSPSSWKTTPAARCFGLLTKTGGEAADELLRATLGRLVSPFYSVPARPEAYFVVKATPPDETEEDLDGSNQEATTAAAPAAAAEEEKAPFLQPTQRKHRRPRPPKAATSSTQADADEAESAEADQPESGSFDYDRAAVELASRAMDRFPIRDPLNLIGGGKRRCGGRAKLHAIPMLGGTVPFATVAAAALVCLLTALSVRPAGALTCSELNTTHKGVLQPLFGQSFTLTLSPSSNKIIVRICGPASDFELFADSAALLVPSHGSGGTVVKLGLVSSGQMYLGTGWMLLVYTGGDPYSASDNSGSNPQCNGSRSVRIVMECNPGIYAPELDFVGEIRNEPSQCHHLFSMQHYSLCGLIPDPAAGGSLAPLAVV
uniref:HRDC domain-containing protein n=1 Tax=Macrostomum lignano TaxID=282301 RepID=A0A1I8JFY6_9PLAT